jgi:hypothetical protein
VLRDNLVEKLKYFTPAYHCNGGVGGCAGAPPPPPEGFFSALTAPVATQRLLLWGLGKGAPSGIWPVYTFGDDRSGFTARH